MASRAYTTGLQKLGDGTINFGSATIKTMLVTSAYTMNPDHDQVSDITNEISVSGYSRQTLASKTVTADLTNDRVVYDAADPVFTSLATGQSIAAAVTFYDPGTGDANCVPLFYNELSAAVPTNGGNVTIQFAATGIGYGSV
jgi:hypothetical protein